MSYYGNYVGLYSSCLANFGGWASKPNGCTFNFFCGYSDTESTGILGCRLMFL